MSASLTLPALAVARPENGEGRISRWVFEIVERIDAHRRRRNTAKALSALSDRELDDIGLARSEIEAIAARY